MYKAIILIGGPAKGTRFRPLSFDIAKPLFPIAGRPMIQHLIEACTTIDGLKEIILLGFYQVDQSLTQFIRSMTNLYGISIRYLQEYTYLGTCGGLFHFRDQICKNNPKAIFVINGDVCGNFSLQEMLNNFLKIEKDKILMSVMVTEATRAQSLNYGCIVEDKSSGRVAHYVEKPSTFVSTTINCGVYLCSLNIFDFISSIIKSPNFRSSESIDSILLNGDEPEKISLEKDILTSLAGSDLFYVYHTNKWWCHLKTAASAIYANRLYLKSYQESYPGLLSKGIDGPKIIGDVIIDPTAKIDPTATIGPNVSIGSGVTVCGGVRIKESIILHDATISEHSLVMYSIVGWNNIIGCWSRIEGTPCHPNPNNEFSRLDNAALFNKDGKLTPSITVLGSNVQVPSELIVLNSIVLPHKELDRSYKNEIIL